LTEDRVTNRICPAHRDFGEVYEVSRESLPLLTRVIDYFMHSSGLLWRFSGMELHWFNCGVGTLRHA